MRRNWNAADESLSTVWNRFQKSELVTCVPGEADGRIPAPFDPLWRMMKEGANSEIIGIRGYSRKVLSRRSHLQGTSLRKVVSRIKLGARRETCLARS